MIAHKYRSIEFSLREKKCRFATELELISIGDTDKILLLYTDGVLKLLSTEQQKYNYTAV